MITFDANQTHQWNSSLNNNSDMNLEMFGASKLMDFQNMNDSINFDTILTRLVTPYSDEALIFCLKLIEAILPKICHQLSRKDLEILSEILSKVPGDKFSNVSQQLNKVANVGAINPAPPPPPPPPDPKMVPPAPPLPNPNSKKKVDLPKVMKPKIMPRLGIKLKQILWTKIPVEKVIGDGIQKIRNVWMLSAKLSENELHLNLDELETMFSCAENSTSDSPPLERRGTRRLDVITLLSHKRSFNTSIFLKQFKGIHQIIANVREGNSSFFGLERLNNLRAVLPDKEEIEILRGFTGDFRQLGIAEQFFLELITVSNYRLRLDAMILKEELDVAFETLLPQIDTIIQACIEIRDSVALPKLFCMLIQIGNFLNANASGGNAAGFRLNSLWKILDMKAVRNSSTLLHYIATQDPECIDRLLEDLSTVPVASKLSLEAIRGDVSSLSENLALIEAELEKKLNDEFLGEMMIYFVNSQEHMRNISERLEQMNELIAYLAAYFCEDEKSFKIEECLKILYAFICRLRQATKENKERKHRLQKAEQRASTMECSNTQFSSSDQDLSKSRTLYDLLETDRSFDGYARFRSNNSSAPDSLDKSSSICEQDEPKVVHRTIRKIKNELLPDEMHNNLSPVVSLRRQSRNKSDAYLLRNSQDLEQFLDAAERVEKEATGVRSCMPSTSSNANNSERSNDETNEVPINIPVITSCAASTSTSSSCSLEVLQNLNSSSSDTSEHPIDRISNEIGSFAVDDELTPTSFVANRLEKKTVSVEKSGLINLSKIRPVLSTVRTAKRQKLPPERPKIVSDSGTSANTSLRITLFNTPGLNKKAATASTSQNQSFTKTKTSNQKSNHTFRSSNRTFGQKEVIIPERQNAFLNKNVPKNVVRAPKVMGKVLPVKSNFEKPPSNKHKELSPTSSSETAPKRMPPSGRVIHSSFSHLPFSQQSANFSRFHSKAAVPDRSTVSVRELQSTTIKRNNTLRPSSAANNSTTASRRYAKQSPPISRTSPATPVAQDPKVNGNSNNSCKKSPTVVRNQKTKRASCSTTSRPQLIRTGTTTPSRPVWR